MRGRKNRLAKSRFRRAIATAAVIFGSVFLYQNCGPKLLTEDKTSGSLKGYTEKYPAELGSVGGLNQDDRASTGGFLLGTDDNSLSVPAFLDLPASPYMRRIEITVSYGSAYVQGNILHPAGCRLRSTDTRPSGIFFREDGKIFGASFTHPYGSPLPEVSDAERGYAGYEISIQVEPAARIAGCKWHYGSFVFSPNGSSGTFAPKVPASNTNSVVTLTASPNPGLAKTELLEFRVDAKNTLATTVDELWLFRVVSLGRDTGFDDIPYDKAYGPQAQVMRLFKLAVGYGNRVFGAGDPIKRLQMLDSIVRYLSRGYDQIPSTCPSLDSMNFTDRASIDPVFCGVYGYFIDAMVRKTGKTVVQLKADLAAAKFFKSMTELGANDNISLTDVITMLSYIRALDHYAIPVTPPPGVTSSSPTLARETAIAILARYLSPILMPF